MTFERRKSAVGYRSATKACTRCCRYPSSRLQVFLWVVVTLASISVVQAQREPNRSTAIENKGFRHPSLYLSNRPTSVDRLGAVSSSAAADRLQSLGIDSSRGYLDPRSDRWSALLLAEPLIPGNGKGNALAHDRQEGTRPGDSESPAEEAWRALKSFLSENKLALGVDTSELQEPLSIVVHDQGERIQIHAQRVVGGILVRDSFVSAVINQGNLMLLGVQAWGDVDVSKGPRAKAPQARGVMSDHLRPFAIESDRVQPELILVPTATESGPMAGGYTETYSLDGSFTGPDSWSGTYSMEFSGPDCATCALVDPSNPCSGQFVPVSASRP